MRAFVKEINFEDDPNSATNFQMSIVTQLILDDGTLQGFTAAASVNQDATLAQIRNAIVTAVIDSTAGYGFGTLPATRILLPSYQRGA